MHPSQRKILICVLFELGIFKQKLDRKTNFKPYFNKKCIRAECDSLTFLQTFQGPILSDKIMR